MGRKAEIWFSQDRGGFCVWHKGQRVRLHACKVDDKPAGPHFRAAQDAYNELLQSPQELKSDLSRVAGLMDEYIRHHQQHHPAGLDRLRSCLKPFRAKLGRLPFATLTPRDVLDVIVNRESWGSSTRDAAFRRIKAFTAWVKATYLISNDPLKDTKAPASFQAGVRGEECLIPDDLADLLVGTAKPALAWIVRGLRATGARPIELRSAEWWHYSPADHAIIFKANPRKGYVWKNARKGKKRDNDRVIFLPDDIDAEVASRASRREWLFPSRHGAQWKPDVFARAFARLRRRKAVAGWLAAHNVPEKDVTPYGFRHTWITNKVLAGISIKVIADAAGTSTKMIDDHYAHLLKDKAAMRRLILG